MKYNEEVEFQLMGYKREIIDVNIVKVPIDLKFFPPCVIRIYKNHSIKSNHNMKYEIKPILDRPNRIFSLTNKEFYCLIKDRVQNQKYTYINND